MTSIFGLIFWMDSITGTTLDSVRPARMIFEGEAVARWRATSAPIPWVLGPVMRTVDVR